MSEQKSAATYAIAHVEAGGTVVHTIENQHVTVHHNAIDSTLKEYYRELARQCQIHTLAEVENGGPSNGDVYASDIYVQPDVLVVEDAKPHNNARQKSDSLERQGQSRRVPLLECLTSTDPAMQRVVLVAPSGFGKSTAINERLQTLVAVRVPFMMLRLPTLRLSGLPPSNAKAHDRVQDAIERDIVGKLRAGKDEAAKLARSLIADLDAAPGVILFDALDEVPQGERDEVTDCVRRFLIERERQQPGHRVLITSRPYAYTEQFAKDQFKRIELAEFTPAQQDELIGKWFAQRDKSAETGDALIKQLRTARSGASADQMGLAKLMTEPMLLTYACMLAEGGAAANAESPLPPTRHELFDGVVSLMLEKWDPNRKNSDVAGFQKLFEVGVNRRSILRQCLERGALQELRAQDRLLDMYRAVPSITAKDFAGLLTRERLVFWLDEAMPVDLSVRARTVVDWLVMRSGLLRATTESDDPRYVLQPQLRDFLAAGRLRSTTRSTIEFIRAAVLLLRQQPQWYQPMLSMALAQLRDDPQALSYSIEHLLSPLGPEHEAVDPNSISEKIQNTPDVAILHFVIAWANAFGEAGPSCAEDRALDEAMQKLRQRCLELVTAPAEGKPPIELRAEAADALGLIGDPRFDASRWHLPAKRMLPTADEPIPGFVRIAADKFTMGDEREKDNPPREVLIDQPFYIARFATTVAQFRDFVDADGYEDTQWWDADGLLWLSGEYDKRVQDNDQPQWLRGRPPQERRAPVSWAQQLLSPSRPVVNVSWFEARAYARWVDRSLHEALKDASLSTHAVRLPTEPQWERAARWAPDEKGYDNRRWPWGNDEAGAARYGNVSHSLGRAVAVGLYEPTGPRLFDMTGNAWAWMDNAYRPASDERFDQAPRAHDWKHSAKMQDSETLSLRGGSWLNQPEHASCSYRFRLPPGNWNNYIGFRVVLSLAKNET